METCQSRASNDLRKQVESSTIIDHSVPYHCFFFCYSSCPPWIKACRFPWRQVTSAVRRDTPDSAASSSSASFLPLCFIAATEITAPKSFSQQRPSVMGKQVSRFLKTFQFIRCEKPRLPPRLPPCSTLLSSSPLLLPLTAAAAPFCSAYSHCTDSFHQTLTWGYECDHMLIPPPSLSHCAPMPRTSSSIGRSSFTLAIWFIIFSGFKAIFSLKTIFILNLPEPLKMECFLLQRPPAGLSGQPSESTCLDSLPFSLWHLCHDKKSRTINSYSENLTL